MKILATLFIIMFWMGAYTQTIIKGKNGKYGLADPKGNIALEPSYDTIYMKRTRSVLGPLGHKLYYLRNNNSKKLNLAFYTLDSGMLFLENEYDKILTFGEGLIILRKNNKQGYITFDRETSGDFTMAVITGARHVFVSDIIYDTLVYSSHSWYMLRKNNKYGYILHHGVIIPPIYDSVIYTDDYTNYYEYPEGYFGKWGYSQIVWVNLYKVIKDGKHGLIRVSNHEGKGYTTTEELFPPIYNEGEIKIISIYYFYKYIEGEPIQFIYNNVKEKRKKTITLHTADGKPFIAEGSGFKPSYLITKDYIISRKHTNIYDSTFRASRIRIITKKTYNYAPSQIILFNNNTGLIYKNYAKPNCFYQLYENIAIEDSTIGNPMDSIMKTTIYTIDNNRIIFSYVYKLGIYGNTVAITTRTVKICDKYTHLYTVIRNLNKEILGYYIEKTLQYQKRRPSMRQLLKTYPLLKRSELRESYRFYWRDDS